MSSIDIATIGTRDRLLAAAAETFAEQGYRAATVREICRRARANVAAINYHFRDKAGLYGEIVRGACEQVLDKYPVRPAELPADPEARLRLFVRQFLGRVFDPGFRSWHARILSREMVEPTEALDRLVEEAVRPQFDLLRGVVREIVGPGASEEQVRWGAWSVVGQCVFYHHSRPIIDRLFPQQDFGPETIERLAEHVASLSICGLRASRREPGANGQP
jgi:AcrR family transcriptional regulator